MDHVSARVFGREGGFVVAGTGLADVDALAFALGADNNVFKVEEVSVVALGIEGFEIDQALAFIDGHFSGEVSVFKAAQRPLADLRPELAVLVPVEPDLSPTGFGIGGEGDGATEAILPM